MSGAPPGQGMPYGGQPGRGYGNPGWNQGPPRQGYGQPGMRPPQQQRRPQQSDSERRYVERNAQQLPESFRAGLPARYEEDMHDYQRGPSRPAHPQQLQHRPPPHAQRSPANFQPPPRQTGNQGSGYPAGAWPARGESAARHGGPARGPPQQQRGPQGAQQPPRRPDPPDVRGTGAATYPDYPGPAQHQPQPTIQEPAAPRPSEDSQTLAANDHWDGSDRLMPPTPNMHRPITDSSIYSQSSSVGTIPDFPMPQGQLEPLEPPPPLLAGQRDSGRQMPLRIPLGPPPSSRRGPSSYYSQSSFVAPIIEEMGSRSSNSSGQPFAGAQFDHYADDDHDDSHDPRDGRTSRAEDHDDSSGLVRRASTGKKMRAAMVPIVKEPGKGGIVAKAVTSAGATGGAFAAGLGSSNNGSQTSLRAPGAIHDDVDSDASSSTFEDKAREAKLENAGFRREAMASMDFFGGAPTSALARGNSPTLPNKHFIPKSPSPLAGIGLDKKASGSMTTDSQNSDKMAAIMVGLERGGALEKEIGAGPRTPRAGFGEKEGLKRPPRINVDAVRDAEARGSLTSLPDLIKRATRLASNLDRGKTASRLGLEWFTADPKAAQIAQEHGDFRKSASLSAILASFPPPGLATPTGDRDKSRDTNATGWPQFAPNSKKRRTRRGVDPRFRFEKPGKRKERRCCGMPVWLFVLLLIVLLAIIVAAVVIPIAVVVLPKHNSNNGSNSALAACQKSTPCQNGGSSALAANGTCSCLCTNGFTGSSCSTASDNACTSMAVTGQSDATVGTAIPRLLDDAQTNFSIPLDSARILAQFSSGDVSCNTENALVTLAGQSSRRRAARSINNLFVALPYASDPFVPSGKMAAVATPIAAAQVQLFDPDEPGWNDGKVAHMPQPTDAATLDRRATPDDDNVIEAAASDGGQTVNGIIIATGSPSAVSSQSKPTGTASGGSGTAGSGSSATTSSSSPSATGSGSTAGNTEQQTMDFARITILFVLQETGSLSAASDAQNKLSNFFSTGGSSAGSSSAAKDVSLGASGWSVNLAAFQVTAANGTQYGSAPST